MERWLERSQAIRYTDRQGGERLAVGRPKMVERTVREPGYCSELGVSVSALPLTEVTPKKENV